jgi:hypothetical protein
MAWRVTPSSRAMSACCWTGGLKPFGEGPVVGGELAKALPEGGVLGGDPPGSLLGPFVEQAGAVIDADDSRGRP